METFVPVTEQMLKEMYAKSQKRKKSKPIGTRIKQVADNVWVVETTKKKR